MGTADRRGAISTGRSEDDGDTLALSVASAQALLSAAASGMMALTGIVFAMAFVMVQFSAIAYSPRLVLWFARPDAVPRTGSVHGEFVGFGQGERLGRGVSMKSAR
jgi:uncharacterized membrane protein